MADTLADLQARRRTLNRFSWSELSMRVTGLIERLHGTLQPGRGTTGSIITLNVPAGGRDASL